MRSLKLEQVAVIKFLTLEGSNKKEIYLRLKNVFSDFTLPQKKVTKLYFRFMKQGLLSTKEELVYENQSIREGQDTPDPSSDSPGVEEDEHSRDKSFMFTKSKIKLENEHSIFSNDTKDSCDERIFSIEESGNEFSDLINGNTEPEVNVIELSNSDLMGDVSESGSGVEDNLEFYNSLENEVPEDAEKCLPIMPALNINDSLKYLEALHSDFNCLLCEGRQFPFRSHLKVHLSFHVKHSIVLFNCRSLLCKRNCLNNNRGHYHCSLCAMLSPHLMRVKHHYKKIHKNMTGVRKIGRDSSEKCTCVDSVEGIFLVLKSKYGLVEPVHVQKNDSRVSKCSLEICEKAMHTARLNGNYALECKHLKEVKMQFRFKPPSFYLGEKCLKEIGLNENEVEKCLALNKMAVMKSVALVVEWVASDECVYFSVLCSDTFAIMGRTLVVLHTKDNLYICSCPESKSNHFCIYVTVSEVYYQNRFMEC